MIEKWIINEPNFSVTLEGCVIALPGRGSSGEQMGQFLNHCGLWRSLAVVLEPVNLRWYPQPNGPTDQELAVQGQSRAVECLSQAIDRVVRGWGVPREKIGLVGFSAGAVVAVLAATRLQEPLAGVVSLAGALLEPDSVPDSQTDTPILLQHNKDDDCFKWHERYLPMRNALKGAGYNLSVIERPKGGHRITYSDALAVREFMSEQFGYEADYEKGDDDE